MCIMALLDSGFRSSSLEFRRYLPIQAKVHSTIQRFGGTTKPFTSTGFSTGCAMLIYWADQTIASPNPANRCVCRPHRKKSPWAAWNAPPILRRQVLLPLDPGAYQISDGIDDAATNLFWTFFLFWNEFFDNLPLLFRQVRAIMRHDFHVTSLRD